MIALLVLALSLVQDAPTPASHTPVTIGPKIKFAAPPDISRCNLPSSYQKNVLVGLTIDVNGKPQGAHILRSSGNDCADKSALDAVNQYKFLPARKDGVAVAVEMHVEVLATQF
jgi:TonB family protein